VSAAPFVIRRTVRWGDTDPAGIIYTPRFLDFAVEAAEAWFVAVTGYDWYKLRTELKLGSPMAHASLDFRKPVRPGEELAMTVLVLDLGRTSITLGVEGRNAAGDLCFEAKLVPVIIEVATIRPYLIPEEFRRRIEDYRQACGG
jgi:4-hydroxybenzoyl-CoA thioesterase